MMMRRVIVVSCIGVGLPLPAAAIAQQAGPPPGAVQLLEAAARLSQSSQDAERAANMARELERLVNQLRAAEQQRGTVGGLVGDQLGGGGRGGRTGGPAPQATFDPRTNDPMSGPVVANAPFSADAITTVTQTLGDGTNISQRATAKFYRDRTGRIRREQTIMGMDWANPREPGEPMTIITLDSEPGDPRPYQLDMANRTARRVPRGGDANARVTLRWVVRQQDVEVFDNLGRRRVVPSRTLEPNPATIDMPVNFQGLVIPRRGIPADLRPTEEQLGTRQIEGLKATGRRTTVTIPTDRVGNDRPIQITDERWESPELGLVVYSRYSDPRTGIVEYRLTSINRSEPAANLFTVPSDYTIVGQTGGGGGQRSGGAGARGRLPQQ